MQAAREVGQRAASPETAHRAMMDAHDAMLRILSPGIAPELRGILLNACHTEGIAIEIVTSLPHLSIVCWRSLSSALTKPPTFRVRDF